MKKRLILAAAFAIFTFTLVISIKADLSSSEMGIKQRIFRVSLDKGLSLCSPLLCCADGEWEQGGIATRLMAQAWRSVSAAELVEENFNDKGYLGGDYPENDLEGGLLWDAVIAENAAAVPQDAEKEQKNAGESSDEESASGFVPAAAPQALYSEQQLREDGFIKETFYSVDPTTEVRDGQLDFDTLMGYDATLKQDNSEPQILVYHTHSQEAYIDSIPGDDSTSIMGVGEHLCDILRNEYGYNVIHHLGKYDVESRDYAYSNAMADIESVLEQYPTIEVIIDLHRDETSADTRLVTTIQGITMAKFMFFNGLSYSKELGELTGLPNPYLQDNLSFAFQMQLFAEEYYPGLTRRIYLKGYRYNMHYRPKTLLIELGSQTNTVEEAMNSCEPLAHILSEVLSGGNKTE